MQRGRRVTIRLAAGLLFATTAGAALTAAENPPASALTTVDGPILRGPTHSRKLALIFTGHQFAEGGQIILDELASHHAKASFFLTGDFLRTKSFAPLIHRIVDDDHYLGPHSDHHLLYCAWEAPHNTLVSKETFNDDLQANLKEIRALGVPRTRVRYFLPPYEHYNRQIVQWTRETGIELVNFTPGTRSNADYTQEVDKNFVSSKDIFDSIIARAERDPDGLNGFLLLLHIGAGPGRRDKFHARFGQLLDYLARNHYLLVRIDELLS
jgi:peptidoglycan/xylan/chitin deacetylase (PgdA/CDA1 family)